MPTWRVVAAETAEGVVDVTLAGDHEAAARLRVPSALDLDEWWTVGAELSLDVSADARDDDAALLLRGEVLAAAADHVTLSLGGLPMRVPRRKKEEWAEGAPVCVRVAPLTRRRSRRAADPASAAGTWT